MWFHHVFILTSTIIHHPPWFLGGWSSMLSAVIRWPTWPTTKGHHHVVHAKPKPLTGRKVWWFRGISWLRMGDSFGNKASVGINCYIFFDWSLQPTQKDMQTLYHVVGNRINYTWHCPPMCLKGWLPFFRAHALQRRCATTVGDRDYQVDCVKQPKFDTHWTGSKNIVNILRSILIVSHVLDLETKNIFEHIMKPEFFHICWDGHHASHAFPPLRPTRIPLEGLNLRVRWKLHQLQMEKQWEFDLNWMCQAKSLRLNISKMYRIHMLPNFFWKMEFSSLEGLFCHWHLSPHWGFKIAAVFFWVSCLSLFFPCLSRHLKIETNKPIRGQVVWSATCTPWSCQLFLSLAVCRSWPWSAVNELQSSAKDHDSLAQKEPGSRRHVEA